MLAFFSVQNSAHFLNGLLTTRDVSKIFPDLEDDVRYGILRMLIRYGMVTEAPDIKKMVKVQVRLTFSEWKKELENERLEEKRLNLNILFVECSFGLRGFQL